MAEIEEIAEKLKEGLNIDNIESGKSKSRRRSKSMRKSCFKELHVRDHVRDQLLESKHQMQRNSTSSISSASERSIRVRKKVRRRTKKIRVDFLL